MISFLEKLTGVVEGFALRFVQDLRQIFFWNLGLGITNDSVLFANNLRWIRIPKKGSGLITNLRTEKYGELDLDLKSIWRTGGLHPMDWIASPFLKSKIEPHCHEGFSMSKTHKKTFF